MIKNSKANNIYIMEMPILGLMIPKKNAAVYNGITIVLYEMEGCNMAPKFKGFLPRFPRWAVYEMTLVFPFHTGSGFFHSIQVQSRGMSIVHIVAFIFSICGPESDPQQKKVRRTSRHYATMPSIQITSAWFLPLKGGMPLTNM